MMKQIREKKYRETGEAPIPIEEVLQLLKINSLF